MVDKADKNNLGSIGVRTQDRNEREESESLRWQYPTRKVTGTTRGRRCWKIKYLEYTQSHCKINTKIVPRFGVLKYFVLFLWLFLALFFFWLTIYLDLFRFHSQITFLWKELQYGIMVRVWVTALTLTVFVVMYKMQ